MAIRVVKAGAHFSLSDAALGMFSVAQQIQGDAPNQCEIRRRVILSTTVGILMELHVQHPVLAVLNLKNDKP